MAAGRLYMHTLRPPLVRSAPNERQTPIRVTSPTMTKPLIQTPAALEALMNPRRRSLCGNTSARRLAAQRRFFRHDNKILFKY